jgi:chloramphenicol-sensitive protein RarD
VLKRPGELARHLAAAILVSANWLGFVWGVTHGRMIECSLGYYLTPLVGVLLGVTVLGERLSTVGLLQHIGPTLQFLVGALIYGEPFDRMRLVGFSIVWSALVLFAIDSLRHAAAQRRSLRHEPIKP